MTHQIPKYHKVEVVGLILLEDVRFFRGGKYLDLKNGCVLTEILSNDEIERFCKGYILGEDVSYYNKRYGKWIHLKKGMWSDGATGAMDIPSLAWWVHDELCNTGRFECGSLCTNWMASTVLCNILWAEMRYARACYWWPVTFLGGGGQARKNGMV